MIISMYCLVGALEHLYREGDHK
jgi:hypothetical protein